MRKIYKWKRGLRDWAISEMTTEDFHRLPERKHQAKSEPHISIAAKCWNYKAILNFFFQNITHSGHEFSEKHCTKKKKDIELYNSPNS